MQTSAQPIAGSVTPAASPHLARAPSFERHLPHDLSGTYVQRQASVVHGFEVSDCTLNQRDEWIWIAFEGEGRWMPAEEALQLAAAIQCVAKAQIERVFREQLRVFSINHPGVAS
ncbi:hypothetical protein GT347_15975 [Xylophilus rhododendri]|uniref:Uncharacterized protein n=1 Tax=Xylophilus rhododendri TaxID=2697032 RepID=A0A857J8K1_9BURK|nr:hypothetical protein [Xylophilus rhododendri]QHI99342.1 hypothetical protein GT347_15975 [Xylophilus rhododendri]